MATSKISGYKKVFGFVLPDWVDEKVLRMAIGYVLVSVVMMFVLLLVVNPNKDNVDSLEARLKTESGRLETMRESKRSLDRLIQDVSSLEQEAIFRAMPVNYSPEAAVFSFRTVANETGVSVSEYSLPAGIVYEEGVREFAGSSKSTNETAVDFRSFTIQVTVEGQISNILNFITRVQRSLPVAFVSDLAIQEIVLAAGLGRAQSNVNLKLSVQYYQPVLKSFNLAGLQSFTEAEIALMRELESYARVTVPVSADTTLPSGELGERDLFGL